MYISDASANYVQLTFDSRDTPDPNAFRTKSDASFDNRLQTNAYGVDSLKVPLPDGVDPVVIFQPRNAADTPLEQQAKFAWKADWHVEVDLSAVTGNSGNGGITFGQLLAEIQSYIDAYPGTQIASELEQAHVKTTVAQDKYLIPDPSVLSPTWTEPKARSSPLKPRDCQEAKGQT